MLLLFNLLAEFQHVQAQTQRLEMGFLGIAQQAKRKAPAPTPRGNAPLPITQPGIF